MDPLYPLEVWGEEWGRPSYPAEIVVLNEVTYEWDGSGKVWLSSSPEGHYPVWTDDYLIVETALGSYFGGSGSQKISQYPDLTPYLIPGSNEISIQVKNNDSNGSIGSSPMYLIRIPYPIADFTASPRTGPAPLTVQLIDASLNMEPPLCTYFGDAFWQVGNSSGFYYSTDEQNPLVTLEAPGLYWVRRLVKNSNGAPYIYKTEMGYIRVYSRRRRAAWQDFDRLPFR